MLVLKCLAPDPLPQQNRIQYSSTPAHRCRACQVLRGGPGVQRLHCDVPRDPLASHSAPRAKPAPRARGPRRLGRALPARVRGARRRHTGLTARRTHTHTHLRRKKGGGQTYCMRVCTYRHEYICRASIIIGRRYVCRGHTHAESWPRCMHAVLVHSSEPSPPGVKP